MQNKSASYPVLTDDMVTLMINDDRTKYGVEVL